MAIYMGVDGQLHYRDDELRHYKYVKREKLPNGKWRYYYDIDEIMETAKSLVGTSKDVEGTALRRAVSDKKFWEAMSMDHKAPSDVEAAVTKALKNFADKRLKDAQLVTNVGEDRYRKMARDSKKARDDEETKETRDWVNEQLKEARKRKVNDRFRKR